MAMPVYPTIIVPGITASNLLDAYPLPPETLWKVLHKDYERVALHPDDLRYEVKEPARVGLRPGSLSHQWRGRISPSRGLSPGWLSARSALSLPRLRGIP